MHVLAVAAVAVKGLHSYKQVLCLDDCAGACAEVSIALFSSQPPAGLLRRFCSCHRLMHRHEGDVMEQRLPSEGRLIRAGEVHCARLPGAQHKCLRRKASLKLPFCP